MNSRCRMQLKALPCIRLRFESGRHYAWEFERDGVELFVEIDGQLTLGEQNLAVQAARGSPLPLRLRSEI